MNLCLHICLCSTFTPSVLGGQRKASSGPLELDYRESLAITWVLGTEGLR